MVRTSPVEGVISRTFSAHAGMPRMVPAAVRMPRRYLKLRSLSVVVAELGHLAGGRDDAHRAAVVRGDAVDGTVIRDGGAKPLVLAGDGLPVQLQNRLIRVIDWRGAVGDRGGFGGEGGGGRATRLKTLASGHRDASGDGNARSEDRDDRHAHEARGWPDATDADGPDGHERRARVCATRARTRRWQKIHRRSRAAGAKLTGTRRDRRHSYPRGRPEPRGRPPRGASPCALNVRRRGERRGARGGVLHKTHGQWWNETPGQAAGDVLDILPSIRPRRALTAALELSVEACIWKYDDRSRESLERWLTMNLGENLR